MAKPKMSKEERAVRDALAAVQADTGVEKAQKILGFDTTTKSYQDFQTAGAALEAISAKPGSTAGQIQSALNTYENAYQTQILSKTTPLVINDGGNESSGGTKVYKVDTGGASLVGRIVDATPPAPPPPLITAPPPPPVKTATLDIILFDEENVVAEQMFDLIFENIGGQELISITRSDIINGQKISYQPIKNLSSIQQKYNPNNLLSLQQTSDTFFAGFSIKLEDKIPDEGNGPDENNVYLTAEGDLIIELINLNSDEQVEVQIATSGTIYEADLGDYIS